MTAVAQALRCAYCHRLHADPVQDDETEATLRMARVVFASTTDRPNEIVASCESCLTFAPVAEEENVNHNGTHGDPWIRDVEWLNPLAALAAADPEDEVVADMREVGLDPVTAPEGRQRSELLVLGDRLLKRAARDETERAAVQQAKNLEIDLVRRRFDRLLTVHDSATTWRRRALEAIAQALFPDPAAKKKSIHLTYGTLGRKDFKPVPELVDEALALESCRDSGGGQAFVELTLTLSLATLQTLLETARVRTDTHGLVEDLLHDDVGFEGVRVKQRLAWSELKKAIPKDLEEGLAPECAIPDGVRMAPARTDWIADVHTST